MKIYFAQDQLLTPPVKRAAFSDRTAYLMAEMSRLAYFKFEGSNNIQGLFQLVSKFVDDEDKVKELQEKISRYVISNSETEAKAVLEEILEAKGFKFVEAFNNKDTDAQAFICQQPKQKTLILSFRGTEKTLKDIKADIKARLHEEPFGDKKS